MRLTTRYARETGPLLQVGFAAYRDDVAGPTVTVLAMVDSGAFTTALPLQVAHDLGLTDDDLVEDAEGGQGVGSHFRLWRPTVRILGGVGRTTPEGQVVAWGPGFEMTPVFTEHNSFLLGRQDFFHAFTVTFEEGNAAGCTFHLDTDWVEEQAP